MADVPTLTEFFGWMTAINFTLLLISTAAVLFLGKWITRIHGRLFRVSSSGLRGEYFQYLANFKILVIVFNLVPFLALRLMAN